MTATPVTPKRSTPPPTPPVLAGALSAGHLAAADLLLLTREPLSITVRVNRATTKVELTVNHLKTRADLELVQQHLYPTPALRVSEWHEVPDGEPGEAPREFRVVELADDAAHQNVALRGWIIEYRPAVAR